MKLQYKYESDGDIELLEINGATCFKRVGFETEITCEFEDFQDLIDILDKCRSKQPEFMWPRANFPE